MSKELQEAQKAAKERGPIEPKSAVDIKMAQELIDSDRAHGNPMIDYMLIEARKLQGQFLQQKNMLTEGTAQMERLKLSIAATQGAIQKTTYDIAQLHAFVPGVPAGEKNAG